LRGIKGEDFIRYPTNFLATVSAFLNMLLIAKQKPGAVKNKPNKKQLYAQKRKAVFVTFS
jgi:hypothetical protein